MPGVSVHGTSTMVIETTFFLLVCVGFVCFFLISLKMFCPLVLGVACLWPEFIYNSVDGFDGLL